MRPHRTPIIVLVAVLLVAGGVADRLSRPRQSVSVAAANRALMPTAAPAGALSSTWFCVGAGAGADARANGVLQIANPTERPATGTVTVVPAGGQPVTAPLDVAPMSLVALPLQDVATGPWASAVVDVDSGQVAAELVAHGRGDTDATQCASRASSRWHFADGTTAKDANLALSLFNPFPEDAIVDLSFSTDQGRASPAAFRPIVVPARTLVVREIGDHVRRRDALATEVVVRTGRVVATQTQTRSAAGKAGLSISLGAPSLGSSWYFPTGLLADGVDEHYSVSNPSNTEATVLFEIILDEGVTGEIERSVPARGRVEVVLNEEAGVPRGVGHSVTVLSLDSVPVVVSRSLAYGPPATQLGRADTVGARRTASQWLFAAGGATDAGDEWLVVANVGARPARISVTGLTGGSGSSIKLTSPQVEPGRRALFRLNDSVTRPALPIVVDSTVPVVMERAMFTKGGGVWVNPGIPLD